MITKRIINICLSLMVIIGFTACQDEDQEFGNVVAPTNLSVSFTLEGQDADNPNGDGSGLVTFTATADNALAFKYSFGDNTNEEVTASGTITHRFSVQGLNTYTVSVVATGTGGAPTTTTFEIDVFSAFDDVEARAFLTGAPITDDGNGNLSLELTEPSSKTWYLDTASSGHLGVGQSLPFDIVINGGPAQYWFPAFFSAAPGQFCGDPNSSCFCDDELTFTIDTDNNITFELNNNGPKVYTPTNDDITDIQISFPEIFTQYPNLLNYVYLTEINSQSLDTSISLYKINGKSFGEHEFYLCGTSKEGNVCYFEPEFVIDSR